MKVRVLFFSLLRDVTGEEEVERELAGEEEISVGPFLDSLYKDYPGLAEWDSKILVAVDQHYVERTDTIRDGQEIAIMPPVQGG